MASDFSTLFEFLPIGAYRSLPDGTQLRANPALVRLNDYASEAELLGAVRDIAQEWYVDPARRAAFCARLEAEGQVVGFESEVYRHRTRERIWISENAHVVRGPLGQVLFYEGTVEEITERVRARDALQLSEARLQQLVALIPGVVYRVAIDAAGRARYTFVSRGVRELYGIEPEEALADGTALTRRRHPDDVARIGALTQAAVARGLPLVGETRIVLDDGTQKWVQVLSTPAPSEHGDRVRVGLLFDITARKQAEEALRQNSELWKRALESSGDGVWDWHVQDGVEVLSPACKALYGYAEGELPDTPDALDERTHPDDVAAMRQARDEHFAGRTPAYINQHRVRCKDGQWKWILSRGIVIARDADGRPLRMIGTHTDVTAARQAEALRHERDRAAAASLAQSQFLSRVSHELRTPLNAILGFAQLLDLEPGDGERQRGWTRQVLASGRHLLALVDDVLDLSSVQTGQLPVASETVLLAPVVQEMLAMLAPTAREAAVELQVDATVADAPPVRADRKRVMQIVSNLLSNAIKYNRRGGWVRVTATVTPDEVALRVADNGPGLDADQRTRLFQPFERLGARGGHVAGTGLGLALSRQLAEAMGGGLDVDSEAGRGAVFSLRLPLA
jgi:PAS domain S-box-containing protein